MLTRADVERIIDNVISERELISLEDLRSGLSIEVKGGDFTMPNQRTVIVKFKDVEISRDWFDVVQTSEYEG